jgi:hypothetical protein
MVAMLCAAALTPITATAQTRTRAQFQRYVFVGPGGVTGARTTPKRLHAGGGCEVVTPTGLGGGAEFGYLARAFPDSDWGDSGIGLLSFNGSYHIRGWGTGRAGPFVSAGYSTTVFPWIGFGTSLANYGAGADYWVREGLGLRFELRDHYKPGHERHLWGARVGVTWTR